MLAPAPAAEAPAEEPPPDAGAERMPMSVGLWAHLGTYAGPSTGTDKINRLFADGELDLLFSADLIEHFSVTGNLVGNYGGGVNEPTAGVLDLQGKVAFDDAFNIWVGRMLVPSDRANFSGFWFASPWYYPGFFRGGPPTGPRQGPHGRNDGLTAWGQFGGGLFKYYVGAFELYQNAVGGALITGRLNLSLINPEPGYYHSSTYYGGKDILAIAIGGQYQKNGSGTDDYSEFNADVLFEKNFNEGGVLDLEGAFYKYMGDGEAIDMSFLVLASWMTAEKIGWGKIQPLVRLQMQQPVEVAGVKPDMEMIIDAQIGYVVDNYATRFALGLQHVKTNPDTNLDYLFLGLQLQK